LLARRVLRRRQARTHPRRGHQGTLRSGGPPFAWRSPLVWAQRLRLRCQDPRTRLAMAWRSGCQRRRSAIRRRRWAVDPRHPCREAGCCRR
jgi:hypothetical protein